MYPKIPSSIKNILVYNYTKNNHQLSIAILNIFKKYVGDAYKIHITDEIVYNSKKNLYILITPINMLELSSFPLFYITYMLGSYNFLTSNTKYKKILMGAICNIDICKKNISFLIENKICSYYMPIFYTETLSSYERLCEFYIYTDDDKKIDVLYLGPEDERSKKLESILKYNGMRVAFISDCNLSQIQELTKYSKVCINIESSSEESVISIINILFSNQSCIISENYNSDELNIFRPYMLNVCYEDIPNECMKLVKDFKYRRRLAIESYQWYIKNRNFINIHEVYSFFQRDTSDFNSLRSICSINVSKMCDKFDKIDIYNCYVGTGELPNAILSAIRKVFPYPENVRVINNLSGVYDEKTLHIIITPSPQLHIKSIIWPKNYVVYQLEPRKFFDNENYANFLKNAIDIWEFSYPHIEILKNKLNIDASYVPLGYNMTISSYGMDLLDYSDMNKDIDVLFLGYEWAHTRRSLLKEKLIQQGLNVLFISTLNLDGMKDIIKRAKVCIDIAHSDIYTYLASVRMNILLSNMACIISEIPIGATETSVYQKGGVTFVEYDNLAQKCVEYVRNPKLREKLATWSYIWYKYQMDWNSVVDFNKLLPFYS